MHPILHYMNLEKFWTSYPKGKLYLIAFLECACQSKMLHKIVNSVHKAIHMNLKSVESRSEKSSFKIPFSTEFGIT